MITMTRDELAGSNLRDIIYFIFGVVVGVVTTLITLGAFTLVFIK